MATNFAAAPNSCELDKQINGSWAVQIKPVGADPSEYKFVRGLSSVNANVTTNSVDASDIDSGSWNSELKTTRTLTVTLEGQYIQIGGQVVDNVTELLRYSGQEVGALGRIDARVWRTDVDEGWEATFNNVWADNTGARGDLRTYTATLGSSCEPTRIHSIEVGAEKAESEVIDPAGIQAILTPSGAGGGSEEPAA